MTKMVQAFKLALKSLMASKMRAFLTMLGIIIGVAAVIILTSLVGGFSNSMTSAFESAGTNNLTVMVLGRGGNADKVDPEEFTDWLLSQPEYFKYATPSVSVGTATIKYGNTNFSSSVTGVNEQYDEINDYNIAFGRSISYIDITNRQNVAVVGSYVASELFGSQEAALSQEIKINGYRFKVVGVVEEISDSTEGSSDDFIYIPYTSATRISFNSNVNSYTVSTPDSEIAATAKTVIEDYLYGVFGDEDYYNVSSLAELLDQVNELTSMLTLILVGIAGISLLVGGIGIMNIMLVSVTERTREIGIRKSLGGKRRDILAQFVIEAGTTSALGGVIGIGVGILGGKVLGNLIGIDAATSTLSIAVAFSVSVAIGIVFGYFPASKASKLNPIDALRYE